MSEHPREYTALAVMRGDEFVIEPIRGIVPKFARGLAYTDLYEDDCGIEGAMEVANETGGRVVRIVARVEEV